MRSKNLFIIAILLVFTASSCGIHQAVSVNHTVNNSQVELSKKNYVIIGKVSGTSSARYVFAIGGLANKTLLTKARAQMYDNAKLEGTSKAIINETIEEHWTMIEPLYFEKTLTVSGYVIEFKD
ncbi:MAG TPA: DUF6567 family protein [Bacteroidia bacterium]